MRRIARIVQACALWGALMVPAPIPAQERCGAPEAPCEVAGGVYAAALPEGGGPPPAVIWLHGFGRSGPGMIQRPAYVTPFTRRGYAVIMPSGQPFGEGTRLDWGVEDGFAHARDDVAFIRAVRDDAVARFGLDGRRILIAGFSRGGSMVWDLACAAPDLALGFAASSGAFWEPVRPRCAAPVHLFHAHGATDALVPFEGREVQFAGHEFDQGSVMKGLNIWRQTMGCMTSAKTTVSDAGLIRKDWAECGDGSLRMWLAPSGHRVPDGWREAVIDWFEALP